ncbi:helix-turn-helix domain-containing protein [Dactylosporangium darangshiense]|uniref:Helix-turn-helix domain-containing protein n=2 Tax=Dactylosporangium darangshiense TaxID=579108 RepID=A0ABP8DIH8_9ACTN
MTDETSHGALASASRRRVLDALRAAAGPLDARELAAATGLHANTVRFHLDVLARAGFVTESAAPVGGRGRPRITYSSATPAAGGGYELLAEILAAGIEAGGGAEPAGRAWAEGAPAQGFDDAEARTMALFTELGFDPRRAGDGGIELHACPFLAVARRHPGVVCNVHLGLLRATVEGAADATLTPFARPGVCLARLSATR